MLPHCLGKKTFICHCVLGEVRSNTYPWIFQSGLWGLNFDTQNGGSSNTLKVRFSRRQKFELGGFKGWPLSPSPLEVDFFMKLSDPEKSETSKQRTYTKSWLNMCFFFTSKWVKSVPKNMCARVLLPLKLLDTYCGGFRIWGGSGFQIYQFQDSCSTFNHPSLYSKNIPYINHSLLSRLSF